MGGLAVAKTSLLRSTSALIAVLVISTAATAHAQTAKANTTEAETAYSGDIIVTATKRSENLQDIPVAITAVSGESLASRGIANLQGIVQSIPSVSWGEHFGTTLISIRGIGSIVDSGVTEPTVALYVDGVFLPRATMATLRAVDLDRVEILRGPQGTLYGRNATGGAVNFVSKGPSKEFEAGINIGTGSRNQFAASGFVSGPLGEKVSVRLSGGHEEQDGFVRVNGKRTLGGSDVDYVRGALRFEPSSDLSIELTARYERNDAPNAYQQYLSQPVFPAAVLSLKPYHILADRPYAQKVETFVAAATLSWDVSDAVSLKSITSYVDHKSNATVDADGSLIDFFDAPDFARPSESFGQEINLSGESGGLKWILGAYYFHEKWGNSLPVNVGTTGGPANGLPANTLLEQAVNGKTKAWALFADATYALSEQVRLNVGLRYNDERKDDTQFFAIRDIGVGPIIIPLKSKSSKLLPKVGLQFDMNQDINAYVQWSRGFKSGGVNLPGGGGENLGPVNGFFKPEQLDAYEIGLKTELADRRVTWNTAAFYYDYKDLQVTRNVPPAVTLVDNADAKVYGLETELTWRVSPAFRLNAAATLLHARFKQYSTLDSATGLIADISGTPLPHAPDWTLNVGADYRIDLGGTLLNSLTLTGNVQYTDDVVLRQYRPSDNIQKGYAIANISATLADQDNRTRLTFFVNNVGDKVYRQHVINFGLGYMGNYGPPLTWGVRLSRDF